MKWAFLNATAHFEDFRKDWDALNQARSNHILLDSRFVAPLIKHFAPKETVLAVSQEGPSKGLALLVRNGLMSWSTFQPSQSPLGLILFGREDERHEDLSELIRALPGYAISLSILQQDPPFSPFPRNSDRNNLESMDYIDTPRLQVTGSFEEYWNQRGKNLKHNLDRQNRRLKEQGRTLQLVAEQSSDRMEDCIRHYGRLEALGWKGQEGTAITENNNQGWFYREILEDFSSTAEAVVFQLRLDDKVVASDLCLMRNGMLVVLKTTYDETVEKLSPALLMRLEIMKHVWEGQKIRNIEFYGRLRDWHKQWTGESRTMFHLNIFRNVYVVSTRRAWKRFR